MQCSFRNWFKEIVVEGVDQYEIWFGIDQRKVRFSKKKFCLVTGMKFEGLSSISTIELSQSEIGSMRGIGL